MIMITFRPFDFIGFRPGPLCRAARAGLNGDTTRFDSLVFTGTNFSAYQGGRDPELLHFLAMTSNKGKVRMDMIERLVAAGFPKHTKNEDGDTAFDCIESNTPQERARLEALLG